MARFLCKISFQQKNMFQQSVENNIFHIFSYIDTLIAKIIMIIISHLPSNKPSSQASFPHWYPNHPIIIILIGFLVLDKKLNQAMGQNTEAHKIFCKSFTTIDEWQMGSSSSLSRSPSSRSARSTEWAWWGSRKFTNAMLLSAVTAYTVYTA